MIDFWEYLHLHNLIVLNVIIYITVSELILRRGTSMTSYYFTYWYLFMKTENSFDLDTPSYSLTVAVKPALLTFSLRYHLTNQNYTLEIPENKVAKIFKGGFSSIN